MDLKSFFFLKEPPKFCLVLFYNLKEKKFVKISIDSLSAGQFSFRSSLLADINDNKFGYANR